MHPYFSSHVTTCVLGEDRPSEVEVGSLCLCLKLTEFCAVNAYSFADKSWQTYPIVKMH